MEFGRLKKEGRDFFPRFASEVTMDKTYFLFKVVLGFPEMFKRGFWRSPKAQGQRRRDRCLFGILRCVPTSGCSQVLRIEIEVSGRFRFWTAVLPGDQRGLDLCHLSVLLSFIFFWVYQGVSEP